MPSEDELTRPMFDAVRKARSQMFETLEAAFPGQGRRLFCTAVCGSVVDLLNADGLGRDLVEVIEKKLVGSRYRLAERQAN